MRKFFIGFLAVTFLMLFGFVSQAVEQGGGTTEVITITNPLRYQTIQDLIEAIVNFLFYLSLVLGPMVIVIAGYFFVTSMGDPKKVALARRLVLYAAVGLIIIMSAKGIINVIKEVIGVQ
jgi:hypothetical protein